MEQLIIDFFRSACYGSTRKNTGWCWTTIQLSAVKRFLVTARVNEARNRDYGVNSCDSW